VHFLGPRIVDCVKIIVEGLVFVYNHSCGNDIQVSITFPPSWNKGKQSKALGLLISYYLEIGVTAEVFLRKYRSHFRVRVSQISQLSTAVRVHLLGDIYTSCIESATLAIWSRRFPYWSPMRFASCHFVPYYHSWQSHNLLLHICTLHRICHSMRVSAKIFGHAHRVLYPQCPVQYSPNISNAKKIHCCLYTFFIVYKSWN